MKYIKYLAMPLLFSSGGRVVQFFVETCEEESTWLHYAQQLVL